MLSQDFIRLALLAGTPIALASGAIGYFVVLRSQVFAGDTLSHVSFTGALAAAAAGVDLRFGLFAAAIAVALLLVLLGDRAASDDVAIGTTLAWVLGLGAFFLDLFNRSSHGGNGVIAARTLFGSIFGLSGGQARLAAEIGVGLFVVMLAIARPLLGATIDSKVASAQGMPVAAIGAGFLVLVGVDAAEATQVVGALLMLGLIAVPAGAAVRLTASPYLALTLSSVLAVASLWLGVVFAYVIPSLPPSSAIIGVAAAIYALSFVATSFTARRPYWPRGARTENG
ncbi:MAG TPA: metal ABC transporter permease [Gaiellaceae bacterium]|nr:metal ABC transporter permease [Gaiellaceae bacterium]